VWIRDEAHVDRARKEFGEFSQSPGDAKYDAARLASEIRREEEALAREAQKRYVDVRSSWGRMAARQMPVTLSLMGISVIVFLASNMGNEAGGTLARLCITDFFRIEDEVRGSRIAEQADVNFDTEVARRVGKLEEVRSGEVWRLVTPMFIHFGPFHLLFNMMWLHQLGGAIERRNGHWRFLAIVLVISSISNLAELYLPDPFAVLQGRQAMEFAPNAAFGGMSAVVFGLFGYIWISSRLDPTCGLYVDEQTVVLMLIWLAVCSFGVIGAMFGVHVANVAHAMGLIVGATIGYLRALVT
jgi:GlpG protein